MNSTLRGLAVVICGVLCGCQTVDPSSADTTPPATNLLIKRYGQPDLEVQNRTGPSANVAANLGPIPTTGSFDFNVLATATDNESGIREVKLSLTRMVCFTASGGGTAQAYSGTVVRKQATRTGASLPKQISLGETGFIQRTSLADENLLMFVNANQVKGVGVGVLTRWNMEAKNGRNQTSYSDSITIGAGDTSCGTLP